MYQDSVVVEEKTTTIILDEDSSSNAVTPSTDIAPALIPTATLTYLMLDFDVERLF
jgi:hypothetical protein